MRLSQLFSATIFALFFINVAHAGFSRMISNQSNDTWTITAVPEVNNQYHYVFFDGSYNDDRQGRRFTACQPGSRLINGPCKLTPVSDSSHVSYVVYGMDEHGGTLYFVNSNKTHQISVRYWSNGDGLSMKSSDESRINDNHGDLTIFAGAER